MPERPEAPAETESSPWDRLAHIPDMHSDPVDPHLLGAPAPAPLLAAPSPQQPTPVGADAISADESAVAINPIDPRHIRVGAPPGGDLYTPVEPPWATPETEAPPVDRPRRSRRRRRLAWTFAAVVLLALVGVGFGIYAASLWQRVERIDTAGSLSPASDGFVNYLVVGTDDRSSIDPDDPVAGDVGLGFEGSRSDSMIVLRIGDDGNRMLSLPRDLWVDIEGMGGAKLNAAAGRGGAPLLISTVTERLGIPIHHYLQVDLGGFMSIIDTVGGISIEFPRPACDPKSGLDVRQIGAVRVDSRTALQYVRSRTYTEFDVGRGQGLTCGQIIGRGLGDTDPTGDIGRTERQRQVLLTTLSTAAKSRNPFRLLGVMSGLQGGFAVDDEMGFGAAFSLARSARGLDAEAVVLPVAGYTAPGGAAALRLIDGADVVLARFAS